jgi:hypothetical protein
MAAERIPELDAKGVFENDDYNTIRNQQRESTTNQLEKADKCQDREAFFKFVV